MYVATAISKVFALPLLGLVLLYQKTLSPDHSWVRHRFPHGYCRFYPSCSQYAVDGLRVAGIVALPRIVWRLVRCHPWSAGGVEPFTHLSKLNK